MSVFNRHTVNCPPFGRLKYGSAHWQGEVELGTFEGMLRVIVQQNVMVQQMRRLQQ